MHVYSFNSLASLRDVTRAEVWLKGSRTHYQVGPSPNNTYSLESALHEISVRKNFNAGPFFIVKASLTRVGFEKLCRGYKVLGDTVYIGILDALRNVRIVKEISV